MKNQTMPNHKHLRKTASLFVAASLAAGMVPATAFADGTEPEVIDEPQNSLVGEGSQSEPVVEDTAAEEIAVVETPETIEDEATPVVENEAASTPAAVSLLSENTVARIGENEYDSLKEAIDAATSGETVALVGDITEMKTSDIATVAAGKDITLDMAGHCITVASDFSGRPIVNQGTLTVTGNGTIDSSNSRTGYGAIRNDGALTITEGRYIGSVYGDGAAIRNGLGSVLTVYGGYFAGTSAIYNVGKATIFKGEFETLACSGCGTPWAYALNNRNEADVSGTMEIIPENDDDVIVHGAQGALGAVGGATVHVKGGTFYTHPCEKNHTGNTFYALYVSGKADMVASCVIDGGNFSTTGKNACVYIENNNPGDNGGEPGKAIVRINGGSFDQGNAGKLVNFNHKNDSELIVTGGKFIGEKAEENLEGCIDPEQKLEKNSDGVFTVVQKYVAQIGEVKYESIQEAINAAEEGQTITLLGDVVLDTACKPVSSTSAIIIDKKSVVIDGANHSLTIKPDINNNIKGLHGIQVVGSADTNYVVTIKNLTVKGAGKDALLVNNGANVTVENFHTEGSAWGAINVNQNEGKGTSKLTVGANCSFEEDNKIWEDSFELAGNNITIENGADFVTFKQVEDTTYKTYYSDLAFAASKAQSGSTIALMGDVTVMHKANASGNSAAVVLPNGVTLDGTGHTIKAGEFTQQCHVIGVNGTEATIMNVTIVGTGEATGKHCINVWGGAKVTLDNVTLNDSRTAGLMINRSTVTATNLTTNGNGWYGVNVDKGSEFTLVSGALNEDVKIWSEDAGEGGSTVIVPDGWEATEVVNGNSSGTSYAPAAQVTPAPGTGGGVVTPPAGGEEEIVDDDNPLAGPQMGPDTFEDVNADDGFYNEIKKVYDAGIMTGIDGTKLFQPNGTTNRAMFVTMLYRMSGSPETVVSAKPFLDVPVDSYYAKAVAWATANGVTTGYEGTGTFGPYDNVTREQMATFLKRYSEVMGYTTQPAGDLAAFPDADKVSGWATEGVKWAVGNGILKGYEPSKNIGPKDNTIRAHAAIMLSRFMDNVVPAKADDAK